jgi:hypothetical protein
MLCAVLHTRGVDQQTRTEARARQQPVRFAGLLWLKVLFAGLLREKKHCWMAADLAEPAKRTGCYQKSSPWISGQNMTLSQSTCTIDAYSNSWKLTLVDRRGRRNDETLLARLLTIYES